MSDSTVEMAVHLLAKVESAPYFSASSWGSFPLPSDLDILRPLSSRTRPWMHTVLTGYFFICSIPVKIMRATQKKMMS